MSAQYKMEEISVDFEILFLSIMKTLFVQKYDILVPYASRQNRSYKYKVM